VGDWPTTPQEAAVQAGGAFAWLEANGVWGLTIVGGLIRHPEINEEGLLFVLCHELGHDVTTRRSPQTDIWFEAIADYFAASRCLKSIFATTAELSRHVDSKELPTAVEAACKTGSKSEHDYRICLRVNKAGLSAARYTHAFVKMMYPQQKTLAPAYGRNDTRSDDRAQCRLETVYAASLRLPLPACGR
jgi:hypothetical protein